MTDKPKFTNSTFQCYDSRKETQENWNTLLKDLTEKQWEKIAKTVTGYETPEEWQRRKKMTDKPKLTKKDIEAQDDMMDFQDVNKILATPIKGVSNKAESSR